MYRSSTSSGADVAASAPAQAFDPRSFLDHLAAHDVSWQVTG
jgi:hypothetical protein